MSGNYSHCHRHCSIDSLVAMTSLPQSWSSMSSKLKHSRGKLSSIS